MRRLGLLQSRGAAVLLVMQVAAAAGAMAVPGAAAAATDPAYQHVTQTLECRANGLQQVADQSAAAAARRVGSDAALRVGPQPGAPPEQPPAATATSQRVAGRATLCGNGKCDAGENCSNCAMDCRAVPGPNGKPCQRIGIMYSGWHQPAWVATQNIRKAGGVAYSVEDVLRSQSFLADGKFRGVSMSAVLEARKQADIGLNFYWHARPQHNFYCINHRRSPGNLLYSKANEGNYATAANVSDCTNWLETVQRHARQLMAAGIDYVVVDGTNIASYDPTADSLQLRPLQVLFEVWSAMRAAGERTPDIAMWQRLPSGQRLSDLKLKKLSFPKVLTLYNNPAFDRLVLRDNVRKKKVFFYPSHSPIDQTVLDYLETNDGRNDVAAQAMWVGQQDSGGWSFFSLCKVPAFMQDEACTQKMTRKSHRVAGSQMAVGPSYQLTYASVPYQAIGQWAGITFRKQWQTALAKKPDWVFITGWNEFIAQPQVNGLGGESQSMGVELDKFMNGKAFVDVYGASFGRDIEPTVEGGTGLYDIAASCIRVFRRQWATKTKGCPTNELCCVGTKFSLYFKWYNAGRGMFGIYATGPLGARTATRKQTLLNPQKGDPLSITLTPYVDKRTPLYACRSRSRPAWPAFLATNNLCDKFLTAKDRNVTRLGFIAVNKGRGMLRPLRRCYYPIPGPNKGRRDVHTFGTGCPKPWYNEKVLGYVR